MHYIQVVFKEDKYGNVQHKKIWIAIKINAVLNYIKEMMQVYGEVAELHKDFEILI